MCCVMPPASPPDDVGVADRVEQAGLAVVDVTHDGDHRRTGLEVALVALVLTELEVEGVEQLAVLVLGADDLNVVAELGTEQRQRLVVDRLGRRHHLAEVEHDLDQRRRVGADLVGEVGQRRAAGQPHHLAVATRNLHAADRRRLHVVELLAPLLLGLAATYRPTAARDRRHPPSSHRGHAHRALSDRRHQARLDHRRGRDERRRQQPGAHQIHHEHPHLRQEHRRPGRWGGRDRRGRNAGRQPDEPA